MGEPDERADDLLAVAEELAAQEVEDRPARARETSVRRPRRVVRGRTADGDAALDVDGAGEERVRVRSLADEPGRVGARPPVDPATAPASAPAAGTADPERAVDGVPAGSDGVMLDADGNEIAADRPPSSNRGGAMPMGAALLADAVRAYLAGHDELGGDDAVTADRRATLRRTLERFDTEHGTAHA